MHSFNIATTPGSLLDYVARLDAGTPCGKGWEGTKPGCKRKGKAGAGNTGKTAPAPSKKAGLKNLKEKIADKKAAQPTQAKTTTKKTAKPATKTVAATPKPDRRSSMERIVDLHEYLTAKDPSKVNNPSADEWRAKNGGKDLSDKQIKSVYQTTFGSFHTINNAGVENKDKRSSAMRVLHQHEYLTAKDPSKVNNPYADKWRKANNGKDLSAAQRKDLIRQFKEGDENERTANQLNSAQASERFRKDSSTLLEYLLST
jgi:hypothetical protein